MTDPGTGSSGDAGTGLPWYLQQGGSPDTPTTTQAWAAPAPAAPAPATPPVASAPAAPSVAEFPEVWTAPQRPPGWATPVDEPAAAEPASAAPPVGPAPPPVAPPAPGPVRGATTPIAVPPRRSSLPVGPVLWAALAVLTVAAVLAGYFLWPESDDPTPAADGGTQQPLSDTTVDPVPALPSAGQAEPPATSSSPTTSTARGDLGLGVPISSPACDGSWVVFLGAATDPAGYVAEVQRLLASRSGAQYLLTAGGCSSMRQALPDGSLIYAVYVGPYPDQATACAVRSDIGGAAYVKRMDNATPPEQTWQC